MGYAQYSLGPIPLRQIPQFRLEEVVEGQPRQTLVVLRLGEEGYAGDGSYSRHGGPGTEKFEVNLSKLTPEGLACSPPNIVPASFGRWSHCENICHSSRLDMVCLLLLIRQPDRTGGHAHAHGQNSHVRLPLRGIRVHEEQSEIRARGDKERQAGEAGTGREHGGREQGSADEDGIDAARIAPSASSSPAPAIRTSLIPCTLNLAHPRIAPYKQVLTARAMLPTSPTG